MKRFATMLRIATLVAGLLVGACACKSKDHTGPGGGGHGSGSGSAAGCDQVKDHVEKLYRAEAEASAAAVVAAGKDPIKPETIDETVADNLAMVMTDCAASAKVAPCAGKASTLAELEERCLVPLDDEGSEGERFE